MYVCMYVCMYLELQKWPDFCISQCGRGPVFFDRDHLIVDHELQRPLQQGLLFIFLGKGKLIANNYIYGF